MSACPVGRELEWYHGGFSLSSLLLGVKAFFMLFFKKSFPKKCGKAESGKDESYEKLSEIQKAVFYAACVLYEMGGKRSN
jgi:hypothetical protein